MIDWSTCKAVERDPARVSSAWVFRGPAYQPLPYLRISKTGAILSSLSSGFLESLLTRCSKCLPMPLAVLHQLLRCLFFPEGRRRYVWEWSGYNWV